MKLNNSQCCLRLKVHFAVLLLYVGLATVSVWSQTAAPASLSGTAKLNGSLVVEGVMVVAVSPSGKTRKRGSGNAKGNPVPAKVDNTGAFSIEGLIKGAYDLIATGKSIKTKVMSITVQEGNSNVVNMVLERAATARVRVTIMNSNGGPLGNTQVAIYSSELPASICEACKLAELTTDTNGEINYSDIASEQAYSLAIKIPRAGSVGDIRLTADAITLGTESVAQVEMRVGDGAQPVLTARLLPSSKVSPDMQRQEQLVNIPVVRTSTVVASGANMKIRGVVTRRDADTFTVRDNNGVDTIVQLTDRTSVKAKGGFLRGGANYAQTQILRGLILEVEGSGNQSGELLAGKVRFTESDLRVARAVESRAAPLEDRATTTETKLAQVEQNAQRLSGQLDELAAVANTAKGGARTAQETADAAVAGVNATNNRISFLDDYDPQAVAAVNFRTGSAELNKDSKATLDEVATRALNSKGYVLEISGFADATGSVARNRALSQRRADAVIRYLIENHNIPLRRIVTPYGYGETNPVAENNSREGRAQNRRVEVKLLVNKGLLQAVPTMTATPVPE